MKLYVYYESNFETDYTNFEIDDEEVSVMIDRDYEKRLAESDGTKPIERRTAQEILNETSREIYNSNHRAARRSVLLSALDPDGDTLPDGDNFEDDVCDRIEYEEVRAAMEELNPQQKELLKKIFWDELAQQEIAAQENIRKSSLSDRKKRALAAIEKILKKNPN